MVAEDHLDGQLLLGFRFLRGFEHLGFGQPEADAEADGDHQDAGEERQPPSPAEQVLLREEGHGEESQEASMIPATAPVLTQLL